MREKKYLPEPTQRIYFQHWQEADLELAYTLWSNPEVTRWIGGPFNDELVKRRLYEEIELQERYGVQYWPTFLSNSQKFIGCAGLRPYRLEEGVYELGIHLLPEFWGRGLASEAAESAIRHALQQLNASAIFAGHHPENRRSAGLIRRLGFQYTHDEFYPPTGRTHPSYLLPRGSHDRPGQ